MNEECKICGTPKELAVTNFMLAGTDSVKTMVRMLEMDNVFVRAEDLEYHMKHCMPKLKTIGAAQKTLKLQMQCGIDLKAAEAEYKRLTMQHSMLPYGKPDTELHEQVGDQNRIVIDLNARKQALETRYGLQDGIIKQAETLKKAQEAQKNAFERNIAQNKAILNVKKMSAELEEAKREILELQKQAVAV